MGPEHDHSKVYVGIRGDDCRHVVVLNDGQDGTDDRHIIKVLDPRWDLRNHSPDGFEWGYQGSGPAQLAIALLADALGDDIAQDLYQTFKHAAIATLPSSTTYWAMTACSIAMWANGRDGGGVTNTDPERFQSTEQADRLVAESLPSECCGAVCTYRSNRHDGRLESFAICSKCHKEYAF